MPQERDIEKRNWDYIDGLGGDIAKYVSFLSVMSRFHRYPVEDLPSFALEAPATFTAVASADFWTNRFQRTLKSNARGVTLIRNGQEAFYYDISETDGDNKSIPKLWQYNEDEHSKYIDAAVPGSENTETKIRILAENIVSKLFTKDEDRELVALSAASVALERMGIPCEETHRRLAVMSMQNHDIRAVLMNTYSAARGILDSVEKSVALDSNLNVNEAVNNPLIKAFGVIDRGQSIEEAIHEERSQPGMFLGFEDEYSSTEDMEQQSEPTVEPDEPPAITEKETQVSDTQNEEESQEAYEDEDQKEASSDFGVPDTLESNENEASDTVSESIEAEDAASMITEEDTHAAEKENLETDEVPDTREDEFEEFLQKPVVHYISRNGSFTDSTDKDAFEYHGWIDDNGDIHISISSHDLGTREILPLTPDDAFAKARAIFTEVIPYDDTDKISVISKVSAAIMGECRILLKERDYRISEGTLVPNIFQSLKRDYVANLITSKDVARELYRAGTFNYVPNEQEALERIGIKEYRYYMTQRPIGPGTVPKDFISYDDTAIEGAKYGYVAYNRLLTGQELAQYELTPAFELYPESNEDEKGKDTQEEQSHEQANDVTETNTTESEKSTSQDGAEEPKEGSYVENHSEVNEPSQNESQGAESGNGENQGLFDDSEADIEEGNLFSSTIKEVVSKLSGSSEDKEDMSARSSNKIEDFGEKIGGARKDIYSAYREMMSTAGQEDMESVPLSKSWPIPNYQKLLDSGIEPWRVHAIRALRDMITPKPRTTRRWGSLRASVWAVDAEAYRSLAVKVIEGTLDYDMLCSEIDGREIFKYDRESSGDIDEHKKRLIDERRQVTAFRNKFMLYAELGHEMSLSDYKFSYVINGTNVRTRTTIPDHSYVLQKKYSKHSYYVVAYGDTKEEAINEYREKLEREKESKKLAAENGEKRKKEADFRVLKWRNRDYVFIGCKIGKNYIEVASSFESFEEAQKYLNEHWDDLQAKFASMKEVPYERNSENMPRVGTSYRDGKDITPEKFTEAFGFRGVEFGNWVENKKRQEDLNQAYDALMDLSTTLNLPPRAMSLCGTLGLAFGARGSGGKNAPIAHYEPSRTVINLTKKSGAGSLAHEWFHALDNYFAKSGGYSEGAMMTEGYPLSSLNRKEVNQSFMDIVTTVNTKTELRKRSGNLDKWRTKAYWSTPVEMTARAFEKYIKEKLAKDGIRNDYLVNIKEVGAWKEATDEKPHIREDYPYPAGQDELEKITEAYDNLFANIKTRMKGEDVLLYSASSPDTERMFAESASVDYMNLTSEQRAMKMFSEEVLGIQMRFIDGPMELHGQFNKETDTIFANRNGETSLEWTLWHEAFHAMRKYDPALYKDLLHHTEANEVFTKEQMDEYRRAVNQPDMPDTTVREEMLADAFADLKSGRRIIENMATENRTLTQRFIAFTKHIVESAKNLFKAEGEDKARLEGKYPGARLSETQIESFSKRIIDLTENVKDSWGIPLSTSKGYEILKSEMPRSMVAPHFTVSPYKYQPDKQRKFDIKAAFKLLKDYSSDKVEDVIRKMSGQKDPAYAGQVMSAVKNYER